MNLFFRKIAAYYNWFPCPVCRTGYGDGANLFCPDCEAEMVLIEGMRCRGCAGVLDTALALCSTCLLTEARPWIGAAAVYEYNTATKRIIHRFKFYNQPELARPFGIRAAERMRAVENFAADLVVPVPLHYTRHFMRSFNQAELMAAVLASELKVPMRRALHRAKRTRHQAHLARKARQRNLRGVFAAPNPVLVRGKCILLVDDVFTTGATLAAAARTLLKAGSGPVFVITAARTPRY